MYQFSHQNIFRILWNIILKGLKNTVDFHLTKWFFHTKYIADNFNKIMYTCQFTQFFFSIYMFLRFVKNHVCRRKNCFFVQINNSNEKNYMEIKVNVKKNIYITYNATSENCSLRKEMPTDLKWTISQNVTTAVHHK